MNSFIICITKFHHRRQTKDVADDYGDVDEDKTARHSGNFCVPFNVFEMQLCSTTKLPFKYMSVVPTRAPAHTRQTLDKFNWLLCANKV